MASTSLDRQTAVEDFDVSLENLFFRGGAFARIGPDLNESSAPDFDPVAMVNQLKCKRNQTHWQVNDLCVRVFLNI